MRLGAPLRVESSTASMIDTAGGTDGGVDRSIANVSLGAVDGAGAGASAEAAFNNGGNDNGIGVGNDSGNSTGVGRHTPGYHYWQREYQKCCVVRQAKDMKQATTPLIYTYLC